MALRGWPIREIERGVRLSETQRVSFYELVTASLKAADTLASACPAETALTPAGRMDIMRSASPPCATPPPPSAPPCCDFTGRWIRDRR